ncbi:MAG: adenosylcobinamide-GDP ribazoletransferase [Kiritimatiellaeota bacterium]|nr:adenosylcobinamide-GDP ribazoletransferase [Kiritimatiellota bacterium]
MGEIFRGLITALRTLTVLRVPGRDAASMASALPWFPLVGLLAGGVVGVAFTGLLYYLHWSAGAAALAVLISALLTGGLHLDGLADTMDGWRGGRTRERRLEIMKDSRIGAMGALALGLVLLLQFVALMRLAESARNIILLLPLAFICARLAMTLLAVSLPYARAEGGTAELFVKGVRGWHFIAALLLAVLLCGALAGAVGLVTVIVTVLLTLALRRWMRLMFGGVTGDLLGFACVTLETALLLVLAGVAPFLSPVLLVW